MNIHVTEEEAAELVSVVDLALRDMSHEIAATDNSEYRARLVARRDVLRAAEAALRSGLAPALAVATDEVTLGSERTAPPVPD